jgi:Cdc6-like AAA superfamily ATPase
MRPEKDSVFALYPVPSECELPSTEANMDSIIRLSQSLDSGAIHASCVFEVTGAKEKREDQGFPQHDGEETHLQQLASSLFCSLASGQSIDFEYGKGLAASSKGSFNWRIKVSAAATTKREAVETLIRLFHGVKATLSTVDDLYRFSPLVASNSECDFGFAYLLQSKPVVVTQALQTSIGFRPYPSISAQPPRVALPLRPKKYGQQPDFFVPIFRGLIPPVKLVLSVKPLILSDNDLNAIRDLRRSLRHGNLSIENPSQGLDRLEDHQELFAELDKDLDQWILNPRGLKIRCRVFSAASIPLSVLMALGHQIFPGLPLSVMPLGHAKNQDSDSDGSFEFDLSGCVSASGILPRFFPSGRSLVHGGIKRIYAPYRGSASDEGVLLGYTDEIDPRPVWFGHQDRTRHCYIVGATGTGKSTLIKNLIRQDMEQNKGVVLIDPHGDLYTEVLESVPDHRKHDTVLMDFSDFEFCPGINFLECSRSLLRPVEINYMVNEMIRIFDRLYDLRQTGGPMFEQYMRNAMLLLTDDETASPTLVDIPRVFEEADYRKFLAKRCRNPAVKGFWTKQAEMAGGEAALANMAPYITSKLNQFVSNALLRPIVGQPRSTVNFREVLDNGQILLVNLTKGLLGELDCRLLGMLILGKIFSAAMSRVVLNCHQRREAFVYVDEFQNFTTDTLAHLMSEARKFGICLTLANQNTSQLSSNGNASLLDSVLGNAGTVLMFRLGITDGEKLQMYVKTQMTSADLQQLPDFYVAARMLESNVPCQPFVFRTISGNKATNTPSHTKAMVLSSRNRYMMPRQKAESDIFRRLSSPPAEDNTHEAEEGGLPLFTAQS